MIEKLSGVEVRIIAPQGLHGAETILVVEDARVLPTLSQGRVSPCRKVASVAVCDPVSYSAGILESGSSMDGYNRLRNAVDRLRPVHALGGESCDAGWKLLNGMAWVGRYSYSIYLWHLIVKAYLGYYETGQHLITLPLYVTA